MIFSLNSLVSLFTKMVLDPGGYLFFLFLFSDLEYKGVFCVLHFLSVFLRCQHIYSFMTLTDVNSHILLLFFFVAIYFIGLVGRLVGWSANGTRADRQTYRGSVGWESAAEKGNRRSYVCLLRYSFSSFFSFYLRVFLFFTARSVRALIIFFCGLRSRLVLAEVFFHCPPPIFRGTGFPRVP